jgi:hypothetical protein
MFCEVGRRGVLDNLRIEYGTLNAHEPLPMLRPPSVTPGEHAPHDDMTGVPGAGRGSSTLTLSESRRGIENDHKSFSKPLPLIRLSPELLIQHASSELNGNLKLSHCIAEDDWQIIAQYPDTDDRVIKGLKSKAEVDDWLNGTRRIDWLRSQGYAK